LGWLIDTLETLKAEGWTIGEDILLWDLETGAGGGVNFFLLPGAGLGCQRQAKDKPKTSQRSPLKRKEELRFIFFLKSAIRMPPKIVAPKVPPPRSLGTEIHLPEGWRINRSGAAVAPKKLNDILPNLPKSFRKSRKNRKRQNRRRTRKFF
jgi:hypothetical protein